MALDALSSASNELLSFINIYDTISATPLASYDSPESSSFIVANSTMTPPNQPGVDRMSEINRIRFSFGEEANNINGRITLTRQKTVGVQGRKKRRRQRICKNKEQAETQRMTHITVERNRRKQMNEHLAVLRSLMPESYVQRGDQASIVGGAIEFVKELEHMLQSLEAQKLQIVQHVAEIPESTNENNIFSKLVEPPFSNFFVYPQYTWSQAVNKYTTKSKGARADIEVTLIETHASLRILSRRTQRELSKLVSGFQSLYLAILHFNVTTMEHLVLYSISAKVEEGCQLITVDDIATAVHNLLSMIEEGPALCC